MTIALLEKASRKQQLDLQNATEKQGPPQKSGCLQPSTESSLKNKNKILWIETKGASVTAAVQKPNSESSESTQQDAIRTDSSSLLQNTKSSSEEQWLGAKGATRDHQTSIKLASWNQPSFSPEEDDLFTDSQLQTLPQSSKRKLPEWFGTSKETVPHVTTSKKSKGSGSKGLFG